MADTFTFVVNLTDRNGNPMIGVDVECVDINLFTVAAPDPMHYIVAVGQTDISGTVTFAGLPPSQYFARPRITHREDMRIQVQTPPGMGGGGKLCYAALVEQHGLGTHTTIQSAINAVGTGGGVVFICGGTYIEDLVIAVDTKHLWLIGASRGQCVIVGNLVTNAVHNHGISDFRMEHLTLDGKAGTALLFNSAPGAIPWTIVLSDLTIKNAAYGINFSDSNGAYDVTIWNVDMGTSVGFAGQFEVENLDISDCRWLVAGHGLYLGGSSAIGDTKISNCTFRSGGAYAIAIRNVTSLILSGCRIQCVGAEAAGIYFASGCTNTVIADCTISMGSGTGKAIDASHAIFIIGLTVSNVQATATLPQTTPRIGFDFSPTGVPNGCSSLVVTGCRTTNFASFGIKLKNADNYTISDTVIVNGGDTHSIYLMGTADYGTITGCVLQGKGGAATTYGIRGDVGVTYTTIVGNLARLHDDITNLVNGADDNIVGGNNPTGAGGVAFHNPVTLDANANTLLSLAVQELGLDVQAANLVFSGPVAGVPAIPAFRSLADLDIPVAIMRDDEHTAIGDNLPHHPAVTLGAGDPALSLAAGQVLTLADVLTPAEHTAIGDAAPHHPAITLDAGSAAELTLVAGQVLKLAEVLSTAEHLAIGDAAPHHAAVTLGEGSDAALALAGQELTLADVLTSAEHTAIGDAAPHHAAITLHANLDANLLALAGQQLDLDTQAANKLFAGPAAGNAAKPAFRSQVAADLPAEAIVDADFAAGEGFMRKTGAGAYMAHKSNLGSNADPGVNDDLAHGYTVGSVWINTTLDKVWQCVDSTDGAAVWKDLSTQGAGGGGTCIQDADADTKVDVEEGPDDDTVRIDLGGAAPIADAILITAAGGLRSKISIVPDTDSAIDLGSSAPKYFANAYIDKLYLNATADLDGVTAGQVKVTGDLTLLSDIIRDAAATARITFAAASPHVTLTGDLRATGRARIGAGATVDLGAVLYARATITAGLAFGLLAHVHGAPAAGASKVIGIQGTAVGGGTPANSTIYGLYFTTQHASASPCAFMVSFRLFMKSTGAGAFDQAVGVYLETPEWAGAVPTLTIGMYLADLGVAGVTAAYGLQIANQTADTVRLLEIGPATPYLRLIGGAAPAANQTNLYLAEGVAPTLRRVQWLAHHAYVCSMLPEPVLPIVGASTSVPLAGNDTVAHLGVINVREPITVKSINYNISAAGGGANSAIRIALYSENGQTRLINVVDVCGANTGIRNVAVNPNLAVEAGNYILLICHSVYQTSAKAITRYTYSATHQADVANEPDLSGMLAIVGGAAPATIDPAAYTSIAGALIPEVRLLGAAPGAADKVMVLV